MHDGWALAVAAAPRGVLASTRAASNAAWTRQPARESPRVMQLRTTVKQPILPHLARRKPRSGRHGDISPLSTSALFERAAEGRHSALSAGASLGEHVHPEVIEVMRELGIDLPEALARESIGSRREPLDHVLGGTTGDLLVLIVPCANVSQSPTRSLPGTAGPEYGTALTRPPAMGRYRLVKKLRSQTRSTATSSNDEKSASWVITAAPCRSAVAAIQASWRRRRRPFDNSDEARRAKQLATSGSTGNKGYVA
jgi:hypothetical protein